jgi:hypothetical protein
MTYKADCMFEFIPLDILDNNHPKKIQTNQKTTGLYLDNFLSVEKPDL